MELKLKEFHDLKELVFCKGTDELNEVIKERRKSRLVAIFHDKLMRYTKISCSNSGGFEKAQPHDSLKEYFLIGIPGKELPKKLNIKETVTVTSVEEANKKLKKDWMIINIFFDKTLHYENIPLKSREYVFHKIQPYHKMRCVMMLGRI